MTMGLVSSILGLPLLPLQGVIKVGQVLQQQAEQELHGQPAARHELEEMEEARAAGRISADEEAQRQQNVLNRMVDAPGVDRTTSSRGDNQEG